MLVIALSAACAAQPEGPVVLSGATVVGRGRADVRIEGDRIVAVGDVDRTGATVLDHTGRFVVPAFVDAHVHLAYLDEPEAMADGGVAAFVDWASPIGWLDRPPADLQRVASGPMITAEGGYPTRSWGRDGYGAECSDTPTCLAAVDANLARGATVVKLPITTGPQLPEPVLAAIVAHAHERGAKVGTHALTDGEAALAGRLGIDVLVHTPTAPLTDSTIALWSGRTVISTLDAFGGSASAVENLRKLREGGVTVVYGTDFGNSRTAGVQRDELEALTSAGLDGAAILAAGTSVPAGLFGFDLGIEPGGPGSLLVLDADPTVDPLTLAKPHEVWIRGTRR
ncbi:MAG: amidohydrolase family protein [Myxococcota bacterium]